MLRSFCIDTCPVPRLSFRVDGGEAKRAGQEPDWEGAGLDVSYGELLGLTCACIWAVTGLIMRTQLPKVPIALMNAVRCGSASLFCWMLLPLEPPLSGLAEVSLRDWAYLFGSVLIPIGIGDTLYLAAIKAFGLSRTLALVGTHPLSTLFFEWILFRQPVSANFFLGCCLVVSGVVFLSGRSRHAVSTSERVPNRLTPGVACALSAAVMWGLGTVLMKPVLARMTPIQANSFRLPFVTALLYFSHRIGGRKVPTERTDRRALMLIAFVGTLGTGVGSLAFLKSILLIGPAKAATLSSVSPVIGMLLAALFLEEEVGLRLLAGVPICVGGVWLVL